MCFTTRHGKRLGETLKLPRVFKVSVSVSEAAASCLGLVSVSAQKVSYTSLGNAAPNLFIKIRRHENCVKNPVWCYAPEDISSRYTAVPVDYLSQVFLC